MQLIHYSVYFCKTILKKFLYFIFLLCPLFLFAAEKDSVFFNIENIKSSHVHIRKITFSGNTITKEKIILRDMSIHENDSISTVFLEKKLEYNKQRILNLQLFSTVNYQVNLIQKDTIDINYSVNEIFYWILKPLFSLADRNFNVWWKEQDHALSRTNVGAEITRMNFRGRNEEINLGVQMGYNKAFDFSYKIPYIDKNLKHGIGVSASFQTGREINYQTKNNKLEFFRSEFYPYRKFYGKLHYSYRHKYVAIHELQLSYNHFSITDDLFLKNPEFLGGKKAIKYLDLTYIYNYNNTNVRIYPTDGIEFRTLVSKKGLGIDKDVNRFEISNQTSLYIPISNRFSAAFVFRGKIASPQNQLYIFNRALGFKNEYLRGYEYYVIDGSHYAFFRSNLRYKIIDKVIHQNLLKFIQYLPVRLYAKLYDDVGYAYNKYPQTSFLNNKFLNGYGSGLDIIVSYYLKFRIEYSFNHLHQKGLFLHGSKE